MSNTKKAQIGQSKATFIPKMYEWGLYFWRLPSGHLFHDGNGNLLNIPDGEPWFYPGIQRATDEEHSEQVDRMKQGLIPSMNDLGAIYAAQKTSEKYGNE
jgi:hypothetical protein